MTEGAHRRSLEARLQRVLVTGFALLTLLLALGVFAARVSTRMVEVEHAAEFVASALAQDLELSVYARQSDAAGALERIRWVDGAGEDFVSAVVFSPEGVAIAGLTVDGPMDVEQLAAARRDAEVGVGWLDHSVRKSISPNLAAAVPVPIAGSDQPDKPATIIVENLDESDDLDAALDSDQAAFEDSALPSGLRMAQRRGEIVVTLSALQAAVGELQFTLLAGLLLGITALLIVRYVLRDAVRLLEPAFEQAQRMRDGDFTVRTDADYDELATLADAFNEISESLGDMITDVRRLAGEVSATVERVQAETTALQIGVASELRAVGGTEEAMRLMRDSVELSAAKMRELTERAQTSSADTERIAAANRDTAQSVQALTGEVSRQGQSLEVLAVRSRSLSESAEVLNRSTGDARGVAQSVLERLDNANAQAREAATLADAAAEHSREGGAAIENAVQRIGDIAEQVGTMQSSVGSLLARVEHMQPVLGAIDDVTASTSLLALNASILAAQAGSHGRPFLVVVDQLKKLSQQTAKLTGEVNEAVADVLEQRVRTTQAGEALGAVVDGSLQDAKRAAEALTDIRKSADESRAVSRGIAEIVEGQYTSLQDALARIEESAGAGGRVGEVARSVIEETSVLGQVGKRFGEVVDTVARASDAQGTLTQRVGDALQQVAGQVHTLAGAQERQDADMARVLQAMTEIRTVAHDARGRVSELEAVVTGLRGGADRLMEGLSRFRTPERSDTLIARTNRRGTEARAS